MCIRDSPEPLSGFPAGFPVFYGSPPVRGAEKLLQAVGVRKVIKLFLIGFCNMFCNIGAHFPCELELAFIDSRFTHSGQADSVAPVLVQVHVIDSQIGTVNGLQCGLAHL